MNCIVNVALPCEKQDNNQSLFNIQSGSLPKPSLIWILAYSSLRPNRLTYLEIELLRSPSTRKERYFVFCVLKWSRSGHTSALWLCMIAQFLVQEGRASRRLCASILSVTHRLCNGEHGTCTAVLVRTSLQKPRCDTGQGIIRSE